MKQNVWERHRRLGHVPFALLLISAFAAVEPLTARSSPQEEFSRTFDKTVSLPAGQGVRIEHRLGSIAVRAQPGRDVHVVARIHASSSNRDEASRLVNEIAIRVEQTGAGVSIRTEYPAWLNGRFSGHRNLSYAVDYEIATPESASLGINNTLGSVSVEGLKKIGRASCRERVCNDV